MTYQKCIDWLFRQLPMYQRTGSVAYKADIGNIVLACQKLGNPQNTFKSVHIAGTNGKGSTSHMLASVYQEAGYKTGLYTSPHLKDFRERIRVNDRMISQVEVIEFVKSNKKWFAEIGMSFFEMTVAMAFYHFSKEKVDIAIIETGLGGRLDSTNIINPELSIITNIGLDHTNLLGDTIEKIAVEKAGIIKENTPVVIGRNQKETLPIFTKIAQEKNAPLISSEPSTLKTDLLGKYQCENISTAHTSIKALTKIGWNISDKNIIEGFLNVQKNTSLTGRWTILHNSPLVVCDTGHNVDSIKQIIQQIKETPHQQLHFVLGMVSDKSIDDILTLLPKNATYYFCKANIPRALDQNELEKIASKHSLKGTAFTSVNDAFSSAKSKANKTDLIFIGGSTFTVAEIL
ncbi:MAG: bifunctional folylpolyglutamate synthase/dihydrofolate synthase [Flavobacteriales bacterium]|nr:bifunctional folylpolyglutamate synthase/dihydrofolate synthase [Flavobacteriales bacterium]